MEQIAVYSASLLFGQYETGPVFVNQYYGVRRPGTSRLGAGGWPQVALQGGSWQMINSELGLLPWWPYQHWVWILFCIQSGDFFIKLWCQITCMLLTLESAVLCRAFLHLVFILTSMCVTCVCQGDHWCSVALLTNLIAGKAPGAGNFKVRQGRRNSTVP